MARSRTLSPLFWEDPDMAACSERARLVFMGLWNLADREGRLLDLPSWIRAKLFPYEQDVDVDASIDELARPRRYSSGSFLSRYEVDGRAYLQINNFRKYQKPHPKEAKSDIPTPCAVAVKSHGSAVEIRSVPSVPSSPSVSSVPSAREGDSDSASAEIGRHVRGEGDLVWFNPDDSLGWHDSAVTELQKQFPARARELNRRGEDWLSELRSLSGWHATAPPSKRKRVSAQRWLFGRLFAKAEKSALHAEKHRPARASPRDESDTWRKTPEDEREEREALAAIARCAVHRMPDGRVQGRGHWQCKAGCGWTEPLPRELVRR